MHQEMFTHSMCHGVIVPARVADEDQKQGPVFDEGA